MGYDLERPRVGKYAVWAYDQYPYFICAKIEAVRKRSYFKVGEPEWCVIAEGYGNHVWVPRITLPPKLGKQVKELRDELRAARHDAMEALRTEHDGLLVEALERHGESARIVDHVLPERVSY